jgi:hypothetical protein
MGAPFLMPQHEMLFPHEAQRHHRIVWSLVNAALGFASGKKPNDNPNYQNDQEYSRPDSRLKDIAYRLTAT